MSPKPPKLADPLAVIQAGALPKRVIPVCFATELAAEYEALHAELLEESERSAGSLAGGRPVEIRQELLDLEARMREHTVDITLQALPRKAFKDLKRQHPPRKDDEGKPVARDMLLDVDEDTFFEPFLRVSIVEPKLDEVTWRMFVDERLTEAQYDQLTTAAWNLNIKRVDLPFSSAASRKTPTSERE